MAPGGDLYNDRDRLLHHRRTGQGTANRRDRIRGQICRLLLARAGLGADFVWSGHAEAQEKRGLYLTSWSV